jgi:hypothetical protein
MLELSSIFSCRAFLLKLLNEADGLRFLISSTEDLTDMIFEVVNVFKELFDLFLFVGFIKVLL